MKVLICIILSLPLMANAIELVKYRSDPETTSRQTFILNKEIVVFKKESNLFDVKKDYSLGTFESKDVRGKDLTNKLEIVLKNVIATNEALKLKGLSFNELSKSKDHHQEMIILESFKILKNSAFYEELNNIIASLQSLKFVHTKGIELSSDLKIKNYFNMSRKVKSEPFSTKFSCRDEVPPTVCRIKGEGFLFL